MGGPWNRTDNHRGSGDVWPENGFTGHYRYRSDYQWRCRPKGIFQLRESFLRKEGDEVDELANHQKEGE